MYILDTPERKTASWLAGEVRALGITDAVIPEWHRVFALGGPSGQVPVGYNPEALRDALARRLGELSRAGSTSFEAAVRASGYGGVAVPESMVPTLVKRWQAVIAVASTEGASLPIYGRPIVGGDYLPPSAAMLKAETGRTPAQQEAVLAQTAARDRSTGNSLQDLFSAIPTWAKWAGGGLAVLAVMSAMRKGR